MRRLRDDLAASDKVLPLPSREDSCLGNIERLLKSGVRIPRLLFCGLWVVARPFIPESLTHPWYQPNLRVHNIKNQKSNNRWPPTLSSTR